MNIEVTDPVAENERPTPPTLKPIRTWPAILLVGLMIGLKFLPAMVDNGPAMLWMSAGFGPMLGAIGILAWWTLLSRTPFGERLIGLLGLLGATGIVLMLSHPSMQGPASFMLTIPLGYGTFAVTSALVSRQTTSRRTWMALTLAALVLASSLCLRSDGVWGNFDVGIHFRWVPSAEDRLKSETVKVGSESEDESVTVESRIGITQPEWSGYRGPSRNGVYSGEIQLTEWNTTLPQEIWRRPVGPAWSSFAVAGNLIFTQEQRGPKEVISCYDGRNGEVVWLHQVTSRFDDPLGGPGPRGTPTLSQGNLFALGASGHMICVDALTGREIWARDLREITGENPPMWGFSSSPLVTHDVVIVHAAGKEDLGIIAFDQGTGETVWSKSCGKMSYGSPQLAVILGKPVVLILSDLGLHIYEPASGAEVMTYEWDYKGYRALQPCLVGSDRILIPTGMGTGTRLIQLSETESKTWTATEVWTSLRLKPDFNDLVVHEGYIYGFDVGIFTCIDLATGKPQWKQGRYGKGQVLLVEDSASLIVVTESGEVKLLEANPEEFSEIGSLSAMDGKTWNHPVLVGSRLFIRNAEEAVCYELPTSPQQPSGTTSALEQISEPTP